jgi:phosphonate transport system ATP-binding protein
VVELLLEAARGRTLVVSTHQLEPVLPHFPRVVGLRGGKVLFDKQRAEVTPDDLARLYQPEGATRSPEPRRVFASGDAPAAGEVLIGASTTPGEYLLPRALVDFRRDHPNVQVRLTVKGTEEIWRRLLAGEVEVALVGARSPRPELHHEDLAEDEIVLVASPRMDGLPQAPLGVSDLARLARVDREPASATRQIVEAQLAAMGAALDPAAVVLEAGSIAALKQAVLAGLGAGFASRLSVAEELASGLLVRLRVRDLEIPRRYFVAWRKDAPPAPAARRLVEAARHAVRTRPGA